MRQGLLRLTNAALRAWEVHSCSRVGPVCTKSLGVQTVLSETSDDRQHTDQQALVQAPALPGLWARVGMSTNSHDIWNVVCLSVTLALWSRKHSARSWFVKLRLRRAAPSYTREQLGYPFRLYRGQL